MKYLNGLKTMLTLSRKKQKIILAVLIIFGSLFVWYTKPWAKKINVEPAISELLDQRKNIVGILPILEKKEYITPEKEKDRLDILILGIRGDNEEEPEAGTLLTDTIMVLSIDKKTNKTSLVSLPRDLYVKMPYLNKKDKLNAAYAYSMGSKDSGLAGVKTLVSQITGVYIDHAILFDFEAFQSIVDTLGGVDIKLAVPFEESLQWGSSSFSLPAGENHLNGEDALYYARSRFSSSDFDRSRRQQQLIFAIRNKMASLGFLANPVKISEIFDTVKQNVKTDIQIWDIKNLVSLALAINKSGDDLNPFVINTDNLVYQSDQNGIYILLPKENTFEGIRRTFDNLIEDE